ncbi:MAG: hypothetical protein M1825_006048 [Sarcosagium campestre]|nr:MAG: hypothetical protein M1825_006048 [Sarcosagium campestre]
MSASDSTDGEAPRGSSSAAVTTTRKRKRDEKTLTQIEVDVSAPEPLSKKALRKSKRLQHKPKPPQVSNVDGDRDGNSESGAAEDRSAASLKRSEYGIWIGNLLYSTTNTEIKEFLVGNSELNDEQITRIHLPTVVPSAAKRSREPQNKGFAYVDLNNATALKQALELSESLLKGRKVLIKDSKSFVGRPAPSKDAKTAGGKPTSQFSTKRVFVGNLGYDITDDDLRQNFEKCGTINHVHTATFEDSGKCKGYAWVEFEKTEAAESAVRGWLKIAETGQADEERAASDDDASQQKKRARGPKMRKWWVNQIRGRPVKVEFAEDKATRYKKRFGKGAGGKALQQDSAADPDEPSRNSLDSGSKDNQQLLDDKQRIRSKDPKRNPAANPQRRLSGTSSYTDDARNIKPGAASATAQRLTGAIIPNTGKKVVFT